MAFVGFFLRALLRLHEGPAYASLIEARKRGDLGFRV